MRLAGSARPVPPRALALALGSLAVPVVAAFIFPSWLAEEPGVLIWMTALVPAFLLAYYRGSRGVAVALAGAMAVLSLTHAVLLVTGAAPPNWIVLLPAVAAFVGMCVALAAVTEALHRERDAAVRMAVLDPLTGMANRRQAEVTLDMQFAAAIRGGGLAVVLFDLDHFKRINDEQGPDEGDAVLRAFADVLKRNTRRMNLSARFGREEFLTVLTGCTEQTAVRFAHRVVAGTRKLRFPWGSPTVSAGVATYQPGMGSFEVLVAAADRALYAAKEAGRDRVMTAPALLAPSAVPGGHLAAPAPTGAPPAVLVVDDDPDVLGVVGKILRRNGYRVELTDDPEQVIDQFQKGDARFDLLVTDIMMPRMNGLTLVDHLWQLRPDLRVLYLSAYVQRTVSWEGLPGAVTGFVGKPLDLDEFLGAVRAVLERAPAPAEGMS